MSESPVVYPAKQLARDMRLSSAMVRKYAQILEEITGERVTILGRDGRHFTEAQRDAMLRAKALVDNNPGMSIDAAMRAALGRSEIAAKLPGGSLDALALAALAEPLRLQLEGIREGLAELPKLRQEVAGLRAELRDSPPPVAPKRYGQPFGFDGGDGQPADTQGNPDRDRSSRDERDGFLVRAARRLERLLRFES